MDDKDIPSEQEQAVLDRIAADPFAGQQQIADALGLARPTVAAYIAQLTRKGYLLGRAYVLAEANRIVCLGGATVDRKYLSRRPLQAGTSNPVTSRRSFGGVARNVAETLSRLGAPSSLVSLVGDDENGRSLVRHLQASGVDATRVIAVSDYATAEYAAVLGPDNELAFGIADMEILDTMKVDDIQRAWPALAAASWVFADCNLPQPVLQWLLARRASARFSLAIDAVSARKAQHLPVDMRGVDVLFLNAAEAVAMLDVPADTPPRALIAALQARGATAVVLTLGMAGLTVATGRSISSLSGLTVDVVDVTGAGDALIAGTLSRLIAGDRLADACRIGMLAAALTIESEESVHASMSPQLIESNMYRLSPLPRNGRKAS